jgi:hypothetical protein
MKLEDVTGKRLLAIKVFGLSIQAPKALTNEIKSESTFI